MKICYYLSLWKIPNLEGIAFPDTIYLENIEARFSNMYYIFMVVKLERKWHFLATVMWIEKKRVYIFLTSDEFSMFWRKRAILPKYDLWFSCRYSETLKKEWVDIFFKLNIFRKLRITVINSCQWNVAVVFFSVIWFKLNIV